MSLDRDEGEAPPLDAASMVLSAILVSLEERLPGFSDSCVRHIEDDNLHVEIRRLGRSAPDPHLIAESRKAVQIVRALRFVVRAHAAPGKRKGRD